MKSLLMGMIVWMTLASCLIAGNPKPQLLVAPEKWIENASKDPSTGVMLDVRDKARYEEGHIPGAIWVDTSLWKNATSKDEGLRDKNFWAHEIGKLGIDGKETIVVYGDNLTESARVWWLLSYLGCENVRLLDGGWKAYLQCGGKPSKESPVVGSVKFEPSFQEDRLATAEEVLELGVRNKKVQVIDNRTSQEYQGVEVRGPRGGHIPGAKHSDWQEYVDAEGRFLPIAQLKSKLIAKGIDLDRPCTTHCQGGGRSSVGAFVMEMATGEPAMNYYRSWGEWGVRSELPIEK